MAPMGKFFKNFKLSTPVVCKIVVIFGSRVGFSKMPYLMAPIKITPG